MTDPEIMPIYGPLRDGTSLLDCIPDAVVIHDMDFRIQYVNPAAERLYGWPFEEIIRRVFTEILPIGLLQHKSENVLYEILNKGVWRSEVIQTERDGKGIRDGQGNPVAIISIVQATSLFYQRAGAELPSLDAERTVLVDDVSNILQEALKDTRNLFVVFAGAAFSDEHYIGDWGLSDEGADQPSESKDQAVEGMFILAYQGFRYDSPKYNVDVRLMVFPGITVSNRLRLQCQGSVSYEIFNNFTAGVSASYAHDSLPPVAGADGHSYILGVTIGYSFN